MKKTIGLAAVIAISACAIALPSLAADKPAKGAAAPAKALSPAKGAEAKPVSAAADDAAKPAGPKLRMAHAGPNPGKDVDLRHCLDLGTNAEVIRCSEQKE